jgi:biopolymer transport protein ExbB
MESQFGIAHVWTQGDFVTRAVAIMLLVMSLASWIVILIKALDIVKFKKRPPARAGLLAQRRLAAGLKSWAPTPQPFRHLALEGREATAHHRNTRRTCTTRWTSATG